LSLVTNGVNYHYTIDSNDNLLINGSAINSLDTKIDSIGFTKFGNNIRVSFVLKSQIDLPGGAQTLGVDTTLGLRP
jgi:hypothetical protein